MKTIERTPLQRERDRMFAEHELEQMRYMAALPFSDKLTWLEEAHHLVLQMQKSREDAKNAAT